MSGGPPVVGGRLWLVQPRAYRKRCASLLQEASRVFATVERLSVPAILLARTGTLDAGSRIHCYTRAAVGPIGAACRTSPLSRTCPLCRCLHSCRGAVLQRPAARNPKPAWRWRRLAGGRRDDLLRRHRSGSQSDVWVFSPESSSIWAEGAVISHNETCRTRQGHI